MTPADVHDTVGARKLLGGLAHFVPKLKKIWADAAYRGYETHADLSAPLPPLDGRARLIA